MRRRWRLFFLGLLGCVAIGLVLFWLASFNPLVNLENIDRLRSGMTADDVIAIMGNPDAGSSVREDPRWEGRGKTLYASQAPSAKVTEMEWHDGPTAFGCALIVTAGFDKNGQLVEREWFLPARGYQSIFTKIRRWLRV